MAGAALLEPAFSIGIIYLINNLDQVSQDMIGNARRECPVSVPQIGLIISIRAGLIHLYCAMYAFVDCVFQNQSLLALVSSPVACTSTGISQPYISDHLTEGLFLFLAQ